MLNIAAAGRAADGATVRSAERRALVLNIVVDIFDTYQFQDPISPDGSQVNKNYCRNGNEERQYKSSRGAVVRAPVALMSHLVSRSTVSSLTILWTAYDFYECKGTRHYAWNICRLKNAIITRLIALIICTQYKSAAEANRDMTSA